METSKNANDNWLLSLLEEATTAEEVEAVHQLWIEQTQKKTIDEQPERVATQQEAAKRLGVARPRLRDMELNAKWWRPEFRTDEGYDVDAIASAQAAFHGTTDAGSELERTWREREQIAKAKLAELKQKNEELEWQKKQGNVLPADVFAEFTRELLGMIRSSLDDLPYTVAQHIPKQHQHFVYVPESKQKTEKDASPLQKQIRRILRDVEEWLSQSPVDEAT